MDLDCASGNTAGLFVGHGFDLIRKAWKPVSTNRTSRVVTDGMPAMDALALGGPEGPQ